ncbi:helix-turn-helix domain-containing protein [Paenibacillus cymbidii]|uniref:helix-turn-helix domain-containing protein n=1 Tax=Paenibacillus cymbidii TaxID=1639034 RepID=UPI001436A725|nr:helix-turn-helix domain-containing protein [Paenibacillus cymbidii]
MPSRRNAYFYQLTIILLLITILPFLVVNMYTVSSFVRQSTQLVDEKNDHELMRTGFLMEQTLQQIKELVLSALGNEFRATDESAAGIVSSMKRSDKLNRLLSGNKYMSSIFFYDGTDHSIMETGYGLVRDLQTPAYAWVRDEIAGIANNREMKVTSTRVSADHSGKPYTIAVILNISSTYLLSDYLIFNINIEKLYNDFLKQLNVNEDIYNYYIAGDTGDIVFHRDYARIGAEAPGRDTYDIAVNRYPLGSMQWQLIGEVNTQKLYNKVEAYKRRMLIMLAVLAVALLALVLLASKQLYRPIQYIMAKLRSGAPHGKFGKQGEFEYISSTFDHMMDRTARLESHLERSEQLLKRTRLFNMIKNRHKLASPLTDRETGEFDRNLIVAVFKIDKRSEEAWDEEAFPQYVSDHVSSVFHTLFFASDPHEYIALFHLPDEDVNRFVVDLILCFDEPMLERLTVGIGNMAAGIDQLHQSYTEALYAANIGRIYSGSNRIYCYSKMPADYNAAARHAKESTLDELELAIRQRNEKAYTGLLEQMFADNIGIAEYNLNFYMTVSLLIKLYERDSAHFLDEINEHMAHNGIMNAAFVKNFFFSKFHDFHREYKAFKEVSPYVAQIDGFIESRYHDNVSLDDLSDHLGITKQYICSLLKQSCGTTFVDYLNQYRIEKAKQLLEQQPAKIGEIYESVGFNSKSYFAKIFKLYTGISPSEYRELALNRNRSS